MRYILLVITLIAVDIATAAENCSYEIQGRHLYSRFVTNGDEVNDTATGLLWQRCAAGLGSDNCDEGLASLYTWEEALEFAESRRMETGREWRLPSIRELRSLVDAKCSSPAIDLEVFPNVASSYWSGSPSAEDPESAWYLYFEFGNAYYFPKSNRAQVRLVRDVCTGTGGDCD